MLYFGVVITHIKNSIDWQPSEILYIVGFRVRVDEIKYFFYLS